MKLHPLLRNILALIAGILIGGMVNMALILLGPYLVPPPAGVDPTTEAGLKAGIHLLRPIHFLFPFLAHALGTQVGAYIATRIAITHQLLISIIIGINFLIGGILMVRMLSAPMWFNTLDLTMAYLPMAILGWYLAMGSSRASNPL